MGTGTGRVGRRRTTVRVLRALTAVLAVSAAGVSCAGPEPDRVADPAPAGPTTTGGTGDPAPAAQGGGIDELVVAPESDAPGYDRDLFDHWVDEDGDGCDTRCEVLETERRTDLAGLPDGGWLSVYDGYTTDDPSELDVDHVVALGEAWDSGASEWDGPRRRAFANDLADPGALVAVSASSNRSKSDRDPASWQPPDRDAWCTFGTDWVRTKVRWGLSADRAEVDALRNILRGC